VKKKKKERKRVVVDYIDKTPRCKVVRNPKIIVTTVTEKYLCVFTATAKKH
jgi:hypothetical protein